MAERVPWLAPTDIACVPGASDETLRRALLTSDGAGSVVKEAALEELVWRRAKAEVEAVVRTDMTAGEVLQAIEARRALSSGAPT